jgi:hypothetical protein
MATREINVYPMLVQIFEHTKKTFPKATARFANYMIGQAHEMWDIKAKNSGPWGERYASTLEREDMPVSRQPMGTAKVFQNEEHANALFAELVENGVSSWSISDALIEGTVARRNEAKYGTRFVNVPFRFRVPGGVQATSSFAGVMPKDIYEIVKTGERLDAGLIETEKGKVIDVAGLQRYGGEKHGQYMTFRTVTRTTPEWRYPDKNATPVFQEVEARFQKMLQGMLENMLKGFEKDLVKKFEKE